MAISIALAESTSDIPMNLLMMADPSEEMINGYLNRGRCYIAKHNSDIVGVIVIIPTRPQTEEIVNVAVDEIYQNQGIAKRLIAAAVEEARKNAIRTIEIGTGNPGAQQMLLYQKCGFRIVGVDLDFFRRHYPERIYENGIECRDMIRMQMEL